VRDPLKIKKLKETAKSLREENYKVIILDSKPDLITIKNGKVTAIKILKKIKGNRVTISHGHSTYCYLSENKTIPNMEEEFLQMGFDKFDYEMVWEDKR